LGKWVGFTGMMSLYLLLMAGGVMGIVYVIASYTAPNALRGVALMWLDALLLLSISFLGGASLTTLANGVMVFGLYGVAFIGGWIEQFGSLMNNQTAINIGIISSLLIPSEALWRRAASVMQHPLVTAMGFSPFTSNSTPSPLMVLYAVLYILVVVGFAIRNFARRDL
jgi:ABC-type transport system involved in multi-copper enzyme maturation permease subunit